MRSAGNRCARLQSSRRAPHPRPPPLTGSSSVSRSPPALRHMPQPPDSTLTVSGIRTSTIDRRGRAATILDIITKTRLHTVELSCLSRLMHVLMSPASSTNHYPLVRFIYRLHTHSDIIFHGDDSTLCNMFALLLLFTCPGTLVSTFFSLEEWFKDSTTNMPFEIAPDMSP